MALSRKKKKQVREFLSLGTKVYHFRRDQMSEKQAVTLAERLEDLADYIREAEAEASEAEVKMASLDVLLKKVGGRIYPRTFWNDNVDMLLVAAIVVLGIRAFLVQPFIIPTNSMYPSYSGVRHALYEPGAGTPGAVGQLRELVLRGARHRTATAPASGEVFLPLFENPSEVPAGGSGSIRYQEVPGRAFGLWPTTVREYELLVGESGPPVTMRVPRSFRLDEVMADRMGSAGITGAPKFATLRGRTYLKTGLMVEAGEPIVSFDIRLGDMLFVERVSYHFRKPEVGDPFVFRTGNIPGLVDAMGNPEDKYYIKRLVGVPGDILRVEEPLLYRNGAPITGAEAFEKNHRQEDGFPGYTSTDPVSYARRRGITIPVGSMQQGQSVPIPPGFYYAMGDNSPDSLDSRAWGYVPEKAVIGRALFVYFPFTSRWGPGR